MKTAKPGIATDLGEGYDLCSITHYTNRENFQTSKGIHQVFVDIEYQGKTKNAGNVKCYGKAANSKQKNGKYIMR